MPSTLGAFAPSVGGFTSWTDPSHWGHLARGFDLRSAILGCILGRFPMSLQVFHLNIMVGNMCSLFFGVLYLHKWSRYPTTFALEEFMKTQGQYFWCCVSLTLTPPISSRNTNLQTAKQRMLYYLLLAWHQAFTKPIVARVGQEVYKSSKIVTEELETRIFSKGFCKGICPTWP